MQRKVLARGALDSGFRRNDDVPAADYAGANVRDIMFRLAMKQAVKAHEDD